MADLDLRPLSLGEILDRTFSIYRKNFLLFAGIVYVFAQGGTVYAVSELYLAWQFRSC